MIATKQTKYLRVLETVLGVPSLQPLEPHLRGIDGDQPKPSPIPKKHYSGLHMAALDQKPTQTDLDRKDESGLGPSSQEHLGCPLPMPERLCLNLGPLPILAFC